MRAHAEGRIVVWEGASLWVLGPRPGDSAYPRTSAHSHHAVQLTIGLGGPFYLEAGATRYTGDCAAVAPNAQHIFETAQVVAHLFVEPESVHGRALVRALFASAPVAAVPLASLGNLPDRLIAWYRSADRADAALVDLGRELVARLAAGIEPAVLDPRVRRIVGWATDHLHRPVSLADAARLVGLSRSRARHLFVQETGLQFRTWLLWTRLTRAVGAYADGVSLTDAALNAGFADSAHFSRTFRSMFGITAASLVLSSARGA
jgi:AraC-like DNA-binding protein